MNHYERLGVAQDASEDEIKRAYYKQVRVYRPEHSPVEFTEVKKAYEILSSPEKREGYDRELDGYSFLEGMDNESQTLFNKGQSLMNEGHPRSAATCFEKLYKRNPRSLTALVWLARAYDKLGWLNKIDGLYEDMVRHVDKYVPLNRIEFKIKCNILDRVDIPEATYITQISKAMQSLIDREQDTFDEAIDFVSRLILYSQSELVKYKCPKELIRFQDEVKYYQKLVNRGEKVSSEDAEYFVHHMIVGIYMNLDQYDRNDRPALASAIEVLEKAVEPSALSSEDRKDLQVFKSTLKEDTYDGPGVTFNLGLNAPCPCGSGKKYKRCCYVRGSAS